MAAAPSPLSIAYEAAQLRGKRDIRVLNILPPVVKDSDTEPIQASLSVLSLDQGCRFSTLSYVWGESPSADSPKSVAILGGRTAGGTVSSTAGGTAFPVTDNCHAAIRALRRKYGSLTIWIDAVCINQDDVEEQEHQITLMGDIYAQSTTTFVWLGESSEATDCAMALLNHTGMLDFLEKFRLKPPRHRRSTGLATPSELKAYLVAALDFQSLAPSSVASLAQRVRHLFFGGAAAAAGSKTATSRRRGLEELLTRPWIQRVWTYQEILFAARPIVVCGNRFVDWSWLAPNVVVYNYLEQTRYAYYGYDTIQSSLSLPNFSKWAEVIFMREKIQNAIAKANANANANGEEQEDSSSGSSGGGGASTDNGPPTALELYQRFLQELYCIHSDVSSILVCLCVILTIITYVVGMQTKSVAAALPLGGLVVLLALLGIALWWRLPMHFYGHRWDGDPTIHLVDELLHRVARRDHDISFGLRAVVGQLLGNELPMPDYALSRDRVFRDLTVNLLRLTGSPQIFVAAALKPLSSAAGGPSWVPNWSARPCMIWWQWHYAPYGYSDHKHMEWQINPEDEPNVVRVQGYRHGTISDIYRFKSTDESYRPAEGDSHLDNLRTMLRLGNMGTSLRLCEFQAHFFTSLLNATTSSSAEEKEKEDMDTQLSDYDVGAYLFFLFLARCEGAARALSWMQPDGGGWATRIMAILSPRSTWSREGLFESMPGFLLNIFFSNIKRKLKLCFFVLKRRENILRTHARLCNRLAQTDHVAISKSVDDQVGICRGSAEVGHQLVEFKNTPLIFVASSSSSDSDDGRIRLVSPSIGLEVRVVDEYRVERLTSLGYDQSRFILDEPKELCVA